MYSISNGRYFQHGVDYWKNYNWLNWLSSIRSSKSDKDSKDNQFLPTFDWTDCFNFALHGGPVTTQRKNKPPPLATHAPCTARCHCSSPRHPIGENALVVGDLHLPTVWGCVTVTNRYRENQPTNSGGRSLHRICATYFLGTIINVLQGTVIRPTNQPTIRGAIINYKGTIKLIIGWVSSIGGVLSSIDCLGTSINNKRHYDSPRIDIIPTLVMDDHRINRS